LFFTTATLLCPCYGGRLWRLGAAKRGSAVRVLSKRRTRLLSKLSWRLRVVWLRERERERERERDKDRERRRRSGNGGNGRTYTRTLLCVVYAR
jgi:hypothetical protein